MNLVYFFICLGTTGFSSRDIGVRRDGWAGQSGERRGVEVRRERHSLACPIWFFLFTTQYSHCAAERAPESVHYLELFLI